MTRSHACRIIPTAIRKAVISTASLLFCLAPAWPHESEWMERGWIHLAQFGPNNSANRVLVDPARIMNEKAYWDAISQVCHSGINCSVIFHFDIALLTYEPDINGDILPDVSSFVTEVIKNSIAFFYYDAKSGENGLVFSCDTIKKEKCF